MSAERPRGPWLRKGSLSMTLAVGLKTPPTKTKNNPNPKKNERRTPSRTLAQKRPPPKNLGRWLENATHQNKTQPKPKKKMSAERPRGPWGTKGADSFVGDPPLPMTLAARSKTPPTTTKYRCPLSHPPLLHLLCLLPLIPMFIPLPCPFLLLVPSTCSGLFWVLVGGVFAATARVIGRGAFLSQGPRGPSALFFLSLG